HLLLGGDNMDIALARAVEPRLSPGRPLDSPRFHALVSRCRAAKEELLADASLTDVRISVPGRGAGVVGGALAATLSRTEVEAVVLDGFFPPVGGEARPRQAAGLASREWGLPFAAEPEVTRHVAEFLARQREPAGQPDLPLARPDAILFNGGALEPRVVRERLCEVVGSWHAPGGDWRPAELEAESLQLAVARGAAYFGLVRRGLGVRIGGGAARTYYLGLGGEPATALCIVPRGMEEGESVEIADRELELLAHRPAAAGDAALVVEPARLDEASALLRAAFESGDDPVTLTRRLEAALDAGRDAWPLAAIRTLWDALWPLEPARARSAEHEARWLNLAGFLLRPGFGDAGDEVRVGRLWRVLSGELRHPRAVQCRAEWWNLWKRIAGGLTAR